MKEFLLVDGYNIIHSWKNLSKIAEFSLESARDKLLETMSNYKGCIKADVIVVFDAHNVAHGRRKQIEFSNIYVVYTSEAETADHYIEKAVNRIGKSYKVRVATSDALEQIIVLGKGAARISAREFYNEVESVLGEMRKKYIENKPPKNNMFIDQLPPEMADWLEELRRQK